MMLDAGTFGPGCWLMWSWMCSFCCNILGRTQQHAAAPPGRGTLLTSCRTDSLTFMFIRGDRMWLVDALDGGGSGANNGNAVKLVLHQVKSCYPVIKSSSYCTSRQT